MSCGRRSVHTIFVVHDKHLYGNSTAIWLSYDNWPVPPASSSSPVPVVVQLQPPERPRLPGPDVEATYLLRFLCFYSTGQTFRAAPVGAPAPLVLCESCVATPGVLLCEQHIPVHLLLYHAPVINYRAAPFGAPLALRWAQLWRQVSGSAAGAGLVFQLRSWSMQIRRAT